MSNKRSIQLLFALALVVSSCGDPADIAGESNKRVEYVPIVLEEADLFQGNKILAYLTNGGPSKQEGRELFLNGMDAYRNKEDLDSALFYLKSSILIEPTPEAYFELGNVFLDRQEYESSLLAYGIAEQLDYEPFAKLLYNKACVYSLQDEKALAGKHVEYALQAGYTNLEQINKDEDLDNIRNSWYLKEAISRGLRGMSNAENLYWLQFKRQFAVMELPSTLETQLNEETEMNFISYDYEKYIAEMRDEEFSREVSKGFYYFGRPYETDEYVSLIYIVKDEFMGEFAPLTYRLATFDHNGGLIDKKEIGGRKNLNEYLLKPTLMQNGVIAIEMLEPIYEKDPDISGYWDNPMVSTELVGKIQYEIADNGKIVEVVPDEVASNE